MINTRLSIFKSVEHLIKEVRKHGDLNPNGFKDIIYAVILNDMREWAQYTNEEDVQKLDQILSDFILNHSTFLLERTDSNPYLYKNTNTPQDNTTWRRIWDNKDFQEVDINNM